MEYRQLGNSGLKVSVVGLGGNTFGRACDEAQTASVIDAALDAGINALDTADIYGGGVSEQYVGKANAARAEICRTIRSSTSSDCEPPTAMTTLYERSRR